MDTLLLRVNWITATQDLTDEQFREYVSKLFAYGYSDCQVDVSSKDKTVNALLSMVKPCIQQDIKHYLGYTNRQ